MRGRSPVRAVSLFRAHYGMPAMERTLGLPGATPVGAQSAHLRRSLFARQWSALDPLLPFLMRPGTEGMRTEAVIPAIFG
jgi:hypothetical protein